MPRPPGVARAIPPHRYRLVADAGITRNTPKRDALGFQNHLGRIDGLVFPLVGRDFKRLGNGFQAGENMRNSGTQSHPAGGNKSDSVFEMRLRAGISAGNRTTSLVAKAGFHMQMEELKESRAVKVEGLGIALFSRIESQDPTALIGLPLIWLSDALRRFGVQLP